MFTLPNMRRVFFAIALCAVFFGSPQKTFAAIDSCTGSTDTHSVPPDSNNSMSFTVNNGGPSDANWVKIRTPSNFTISGSASVPSGWEASINGENTEMTVSSSSETFGTGADFSFSVQVTSANTTAASADWAMQASEDGGATTVDCGGGSRGIAIEGTPTVADPSISDIVVSDISDTQAKISWNTDVAATSVIDYGTTTDYGSTSSDTSLVTPHSRTLTGLSANTTYHYNVKSARSEGNTAESGDNTFTTAQQGTTTTVTVTGTTRTVTVTPTPSPTPVPDTFPPTVSVSTDFKKAFKVAPAITGKASDPAGVVKLEYSLDGGQTFQPVDTVSDLGGRATTFSFTPANLLDDNYVIKIRATDGKGNAGVTDIGTMVIDRLPPRVGGYVVVLGPQQIQPTSNGTFLMLPRMNYKITLSVIGGPTTVAVSSLSESGESATIPLTKNSDTGLWSGQFMFMGSGNYTLTASAVDGAANQTTVPFAHMKVYEGGTVTASKDSLLGDAGKPITNGEITVYYYNEMTHEFSLWDGVSFGIVNPQPLTREGKYQVYLPAGTYYVRIHASGYRSLVSPIFTVTQAGPFLSNFTLVHARMLVIGPWYFTLPDFRQTTQDVSLFLPPVSSGVVSSSLVNHEFPFKTYANGDATLSTLDLRGKLTFVTILNTWLPQATAELDALEGLSHAAPVNVLVIVPHESVSSVAIFKKRTGLTIPIVADPDGDIIETMGLRTFPLHILVNRKGVVQIMKTGIYSQSELFAMISE